MDFINNYLYKINKKDQFYLNKKTTGSFITVLVICRNIKLTIYYLICKIEYHRYLIKKVEFKSL